MTDQSSPSPSDSWPCVLELDSDRKLVSGSFEKFRQSIREGADLRIYTGFYHDEHLEPGCGNHELVHEISQFATTYEIDGAWAAGIMTGRMPMNAFGGFYGRPSLSFFLYNENGEQAIARPHLDGAYPNGEPGPSPLDDHSAMPKYHQFDGWDAQTNAPSSNFVYDFEHFGFHVNNVWEEVYANDAEGRATFGKLDTLVESLKKGYEIKVGIRGICADLAKGKAMNHTLFVQTGPGYFHENTGLFYAETFPTVRVAPGIPMRYSTGNWDFGCFIPRTDGMVFHWICDPYTLKFTKTQTQNAVRWFVRR